MKFCKPTVPVKRSFSSFVHHLKELWLVREGAAGAAAAVDASDGGTSSSRRSCQSTTIAPQSSSSREAGSAGVSTTGSATASEADAANRPLLEAAAP